VYRTDALADPGVVVVDTFPAGTHRAIVYPGAVVSHGGADAAPVLTFLNSPAAMTIFAKFGFTRPK
jgi:molybdate transport system substrate-binding protein